ncbi:hypothetical protein TNIN_62601 [Trichonephila inaurata madagascariensis]|uniref:Uncharacterized protein n=1 Tax=Trichonephila inaurata madagascariensis TaxID=2747483 RepID=A0A8X6XH45_9ARAC|nr:hypothetical protein TNIN_62601 [Trichonephila inaurata madagascariensis]
MQGSEREDSVDIFIVRQCIQTANDCPLGMHSKYNDLLSENFESRSERLILSESLLFNPELEVSVLQGNLLDANVRRNSKKNFDSQSESPLFNPELEVPVLQSNHFDANVGRNSENKSEGLILSEIPLFKPESEIPVPQCHHLDENADYSENSENKSKSI